MSEAMNKFNATADAIKNQTMTGSKEEKTQALFDAALDVWNDDIAGEFDLSDGSHVRIHEI